MATEICLIYIKDIFNPNLFPKAIYTPRLQTTLCLVPKLDSEGKTFTYLIRGIYENFRMILEFSFFAKIKKHEKHVPIFIYLITYYFWNEKKKKMHFSFLDYTYNLDYDSKIQKLGPFRGIQWWVFTPHRTLKSHSGKPFCLYSAWRLCRLWVLISTNNPQLHHKLFKSPILSSLPITTCKWFHLQRKGVALFNESPWVPHKWGALCEEFPTSEISISGCLFESTGFLLCYCLAVIIT